MPLRLLKYFKLFKHKPDRNLQHKKINKRNEQINHQTDQLINQPINQQTKKKKQLADAHLTSYLSTKSSWCFLKKAQAAERPGAVMATLMMTKTVSWFLTSS